MNDNHFDESDIFPKPESIGERPWGTEDLLAIVSKQFSVKRISINKGNKGGLQYHRLKDEVAILISGEMLIRYDTGDGVLKEKVLGPGQAAHFPAGLVHQEEALTDCVIIEASTPHFNDRVRVEEEYGLGKSEGMPTTSEDQIELR
jgi:mannose-6-phosphate isomerase